MVALQPVLLGGLRQTVQSTGASESPVTPVTVFPQGLVVEYAHTLLSGDFKLDFYTALTDKD